MPTPQEIQQLLEALRPRQPMITLGGLTSPQGLLGLGLLGGSLTGREEPGYVREARQNIRNLSSPTGFSSGFTNTVGGLQSQFQPLLDQQQKRALDQIQQRYTAAFPSTFGPQGPEFGAYGNYLRDQFLPQQQAFYGNIGLQGLQTQLGAAGKILELDRPDPFKQALAQLGGALILGSNQGGGFGFPGTGSGQGGGFDPGSIFRGAGSSGGGDGGGFLNAIGNALNPGRFLMGQNQGVGLGGILNNLAQGQGLTASGVGNLQNIASLFTGGNSLAKGLGFVPGAATGAFSTLSPAANAAFTSSVSELLGGQAIGGFEMLADGSMSVLGESGAAIGTVTPAGTVLGASGEVVGPVAGASGGGLLSSVATPLAAGLGGFLSGRAIGSQLPGTQLGATAAGAAGGALAGAAAGAVMGSIFDGPGAAVGAMIGALAGGGGGFLGSRGAAHRLKATQLANDQRSQQGTFGSMASFWTSALGEAGYQDLDGWNRFTQNLSQRVNNPAESYSYGGISANVDQIDAMPHFGSRLLLKQIQQGGHPEIASLDQLPPAPDGTTFRQTYIDYIMQNTWIGGEGRRGLSHPSNIGQKGGLLTHAGLSL